MYPVSINKPESEIRLEPISTDVLITPQLQNDTNGETLASEA